MTATLPLPSNSYECIRTCSRSKMPQPYELADSGIAFATNQSPGIPQADIPNRLGRDLFHRLASVVRVSLEPGSPKNATTGTPIL